MDLKQKLSGMSEAQLHKCLKEIVTKSVNRYKQELLGENDQLLDQDLRKYRAKIARISSKTAQKWCKWVKEGPVLMPDFTRIYYRKGKTEVILQEYHPQIRLLRFQGSLVSRMNTGTRIADQEWQKIYNFSLALPYVIFIFKFVDGLFVEVKCAFSDRPLKRLEEKPIKPYLSNIDTTLKVCLGGSLDKGALERGNLTQQVALVLNNFWQTVFTDEWSTHFWQSREHFVATGEHRLTTFTAWQNASVQNSLFVVENLNWLKHSDESFGETIIKMLDGDEEYTHFTDDLYEKLSAAFVEEVKGTIEKNLGSAETRVVAAEYQILGEVFPELKAG